MRAEATNSKINEPVDEYVPITPRQIQIGEHCNEHFGSDKDSFLKPLRSSTHLAKSNDWEKVRRNLNSDGYIFFRELISREKVLRAKSFLLDDLNSRGILEEREGGILKANCGIHCVPFMEGVNDLTHSNELLDIFEGDELVNAFKNILNVPDVKTFDFKWLRAVPNAKYTGIHCDAVYKSRGSKNLLTCWIPLGDTPLEMGGLCMCESSHSDENFRKLRSTYGKLDHEKDKLDGSGWFSIDPKEITQLFGGQWRSADFLAGDALIFTMHTLHMSTTNVTNIARLSADVRFQPASDEIDARYMGKDRIREWLKGVPEAGMYADEAHTDDAKKGEEDATKKITMKSLREAWGYPMDENKICV